MEYSIDIMRLREFQALLARNREIVFDELGKAAYEVDNFLTAAVVARMPTATGTLAKSVTHEERIDGTGVSGLVTTPHQYAIPVELGTRPHLPPIQPLVDWVKVKFAISSEADARSFAKAIAWKIFHHGTKPQRPFGDAFDAHEEWVRKRFDQAAAQITARLSGGGGGNV